MATPAQILANRENSKHSTAPRTPEGKEISNANAKTHGFSAADPVLPHEDRSQFDALVERYESEFAPTTAHEEFLLRQMVGARWKLDRLERIEIAILAPLATPGDPDADALIAQALTDKDAGTALARLDRYRATLERTYHRCARELRATRREQNEANSTEIAEKKFEKLLHRMMEAPPPEGKAASSINAKSRGLTAADPVLPHEGREQFN